MTVFMISKDDWKDDPIESFVQASDIAEALKKVKEYFGRKGGKTDVDSGFVLFEDGHKEGECLLTATESEMMSPITMKRVVTKAFPDFIAATLQEKGIATEGDIKPVDTASYDINGVTNPDILATLSEAAKTYGVKLTGDVTYEPGVSTRQPSP